MPTTVAEAFAGADLGHDDIATVRWGTKPMTSKSGVYIVSLTKCLDTCDGGLNKAPLAEIEFCHWLRVCPRMTLDGVHAGVGQLIDRISRFWIPNEVVLYIGKATKLSTRLSDYYRTRIGERSPHSGGFFLKLLSDLNQLWADCPDPKVAEDKMLQRFCGNLSANSRKALHDPLHPLPFANQEWPKGTSKAHGLKDHRETSGSKSSDKTRSVARASAVAPAIEKIHSTLPVTTNDIKKNQIRIPSRKGCLTSSLFPRSKARVEVVLRGQTVRVSWNPRTHDNRQRSGVLTVGTKLHGLVGEVLFVSVQAGGIVHID